MGVAGSLGIDEGGVLQALSEPMIWRETILYKYNKKGLVISQTTSRHQVSLAMVFGVTLIAAAIALLIMFRGENGGGVSRFGWGGSIPPPPGLTAEQASNWTTLVGFLEVLPGTSGLLSLKKSLGF